MRIAIKYRIGKRKKQHELAIEQTLNGFMASKEYEDYKVYHYRFSSCIYKYLSKNIEGIKPLMEWQYYKLEEYLKSML